MYGDALKTMQGCIRDFLKNEEKLCPQAQICTLKKENGYKMIIPEDAYMLLSFVNLKLRDYYSDLEAMCDDMDVSSAEIEEKLKGIGYSYDRERNQFL